MSLKKQELKSKSVCKVTFRIPKSVANNAESVSLAGDFNNWESSGCVMSKLKTGEFTITLELEKDKTYEFRYLIDEQHWLNDPEADDYVPNGFGGENSLLVL